MDLHSFTEKLRSQASPVVVELWAPWCMPCRAISPVLEKLAKRYEGRVDLWKINADENPALLEALGIRGIPTLLVYQGEREIMRSIGAQPSASLAHLFEAALSGTAPARRVQTSLDRLFRLVVGTVLLLFGWTTGPSIVLLLLGSAVLFSAVYDRCPIWRAVTSRFSKWMNARGRTRIDREPG